MSGITSSPTDASVTYVPGHWCYLSSRLFSAGTMVALISRSDGKPTKIAAASDGCPPTCVRYSDARFLQCEEASADLNREPLLDGRDEPTGDRRALTCSGGP